MIEKNILQELLKSNPVVVRTDTMTHEAWLEKRRGSIGGSDAGAIAGLSKYGSPLSVYFDKKGLSSFSGNAATRRGQIFEPVIRNETAKELGVAATTVPFMIFHREYDFIAANLDGVVYADRETDVNGTRILGLGGHEIKTSRNGAGFGDEEVPDGYYCQVQHYMAVTGLPWFLLSVFVTDSDELLHYYVPRNEVFIEELIAKEVRFWREFVEKDICPAPLGLDIEDEMVTALYTGNDGIELDAEAESLAAEYSLLSNEIRGLTAKKEQAKIKLKMMIAERSAGSAGKKGYATAGAYKISWSKPVRKSLDTDRIKKDGLYEKYIRESESDMFRISGGK